MVCQRSVVCGTLMSRAVFQGSRRPEKYAGGRASVFSASPNTTTVIYDECLSLGHRIWCGANPDCHSWDVEKYDSPYNGYSVVYAESLTREAILDSLKNGRFYASTGLELGALNVSDSAIEAASERSRKIRFYGRHGALLEEIENDHAEYRFRGDEGYIRTELEGETAENSRMTTAQAWLQPAWVE